MTQVETASQLKTDPLKIQISTFDSAFGWFGLLEHEHDRIVGLKIGHRTESAALDAVTSMLDDEETEPHELVAKRWPSEIAQRLIEFTQGEPADFSDVKLLYPKPLTKFQTKVIKATRRIPFGQTAPYAQIAVQAGSPRAARAVGTCMKNNRFPIIVPCHRVVASGGLGGFSAPNGVSLKRQLLTMEANRVEVNDHLA
jgi:methylated-DNA-[protein]-cysteine S-methyltransferase